MLGTQQGIIEFWFFNKGRSTKWLRETEYKKEVERNGKKACDFFIVAIKLCKMFTTKSLWHGKISFRAQVSEVRSCESTELPCGCLVGNKLIQANFRWESWSKFAVLNVSTLGQTRPHAKCSRSQKQANWLCILHPTNPRKPHGQLHNSSKQMWWTWIHSTGNNSNHATLSLTSTRKETKVIGQMWDRICCCTECWCVILCLINSLPQHKLIEIFDFLLNWKF